LAVKDLNVEEFRESLRMIAINNSEVVLSGG
jgi:hypothetical protein